MSCLLATGYIHHLLDEDMTFAQWVRYCSNVRGIEEQTDYDAVAHHAKALAQSRAERERLLAMSDAERHAWGWNKKDEEIKEALAGIAEKEKAAAKLASMRSQLEDWQPPELLADLKAMMIRQIDETKVDLGWHQAKIQKLRDTSPALTFYSHLSELEWEIAYHAKEEIEEQQKAERWAEYVSALRQAIEEAERNV
jgi:hypothetical protein